jgi:hypothetical protein
MYNFLSACTAFGGLTLGIIMGDLETSAYVFAFAGGLFLYVSLADLVSIKITHTVSGYMKGTNDTRHCLEICKI